MARKMSNMGLKMKNIRENLGDTKRRKPRVLCDTWRDDRCQEKIFLTEVVLVWYRGGAVGGACGLFHISFALLRWSKNKHD